MEYCTKSTYVLEYCGRRTSNVMSDRRAAFDAAKKTRTGAKIWVSQSVKEAEELRNQLESSVEISKNEYVETFKSLSTRLNAWRKAQADVEFLNENIQDFEADIDMADDFSRAVEKTKLKLIKAWSRAKKETHVSEETVDVSCELSGPKDTAAGEVSDDCETPTCEENVMVEDFSFA